MARAHTGGDNMPAIVFENASVFDGHTPALAENVSVLVQGETITKISAAPIRVPDATYLDCRGQILMPGLIDNHVHIYLDSLKLSPPEPPITYRAQFARKFLENILACGFTTVRDVGGGDYGMSLALKHGFLTGPRFFYGGLCLTQTGGHADMRLPEQQTDYCTCGAEKNVLAIVADGVEECIKATREELRKGASHIKIMASGGVMSPSDPLERCQYSDAEIRAIVDECGRHGSYVCAHCHPSEAIRRCVELGVRCIEHGTMMDEEAAAFVAERGAYVVPTMAVIFALLEGVETGEIPSASIRKLRTVSEYALKSLEIMKRAGIKMGFGTDLLGPQHTRQGTEFSLRRRVLTSYEILHSATAINAEILQMQGKLGVIAEGAFADILVVAGNPLQNIELLAANGRFLTYIMSNGRLLKSPSPS